MNAWEQQKLWAKRAFFRWKYGWQYAPCTACNGSGHYDNDGAPPCQGCEPPGSGRAWIRGPKAVPRNLTNEQLDKWIETIEKQD